MVHVTLKWGTKQIQADVDLSAPVATFQETIYGLTQVPPGSQKIIFKGTLFKADTNLSNLKIVEGSAITLMGAPEQNQIKEIQEERKFYEEMTPEERAQVYKEKTGEVLATGLVNMGNTCYMNSSIQCLRRIDELKNYLINNRFAPNGDPKALLVTKALAGLFKDLEGKG